MLQHRASALALVTGAIALWNTVYLGRALDALRARGDAIPDALLAHLAPSGWQHINLTGDYLWGADGASARMDSGRCETWSTAMGRRRMMFMLRPISVYPAPVLLRNPQQAAGARRIAPHLLSRLADRDP